MKKTWRLPCPIQAARKATEHGNAMRKTNRIYRDQWRLRSEEHAQEREWEMHWGACVRQLRRIFSREFQHPKWKRLSISWVGRGYQQNGLTKRVDLFLTYRVFWHGMIFERTIWPKTREDMVAEAWRLAGAMLAWTGEE